MRKASLFALTSILSLMALAQEGETKKIDVDIDTNSGNNWYASPIVWVIGAAVFILLLVALMRGGSRKAD